MKFYSSVRIDIRRIGAIKDGDQNVGNRVRTRVVKNKIAPPFRDAEFDIMFNEGISKTGDLLDLAVVDGHVKKAGAWFSYGEIRLGQGRENSKIYISEHQELFDELRTKVMISRGVIEDPNAVVEEPVATDAEAPPEPSEETPAS